MIQRKHMVVSNYKKKAKAKDQDKDEENFELASMQDQARDGVFAKQRLTAKRSCWKKVSSNTCF